MAKNLRKSVLMSVLLSFGLLSGCANFQRSHSAIVFEPSENYFSVEFKENDLDFVVQNSFEQLKQHYSPVNTRFNVLNAKDNDKFGGALKEVLLKSGYSVFEVADLSTLKRANLKSVIDEVNAYNLTYSFDSMGSGVYFVGIKVYTLNNERIEIYNRPFLFDKGKWSGFGSWTTSILGGYESDEPSVSEKIKDNFFAIKDGVF